MFISRDYKFTCLVVNTSMDYITIQFDIVNSRLIRNPKILYRPILPWNNKLVIHLIPQYLHGLALYFKRTDLTQPQQIKHNNRRVNTPAIPTSNQLSPMAIYNILASLDLELVYLFEFGE